MSIPLIIHYARRLNHNLQIQIQPGALQLSDLNVEEVARQLTLIEYDLFKAIKPWECLGQAWTKKDKEIKAPNIIAMIKRFNYVRVSSSKKITRTHSFLSFFLPL